MTEEDRASEALAHLQGAALEVIAAMRAVLDVAEELVRDPAPLAAAASAVSDVLAPFVARARAAAPDGRGTADEGAEDLPPRQPRVQHIRVC